MRWFLTFLTAALVLSAHAGTASACLNDRETIKAEKEFKSSYVDKDTAPEYQPGPLAGDRLLRLGSYGLGAALLVGAGVMGFRGRRD